jgi:hypothetical protein
VTALSHPLAMLPQPARTARNATLLILHTA